MQTWDYGDMTFAPNFNFLEFMSEKEYTKWSANHGYQPRTMLLDEVVPGERYVVVITNFLGGAYIRYMLGDMVEITALHNSNLNINLPQTRFYSRADNVLDFAGASLTEKAIWQSIEDAGLDYVDWVARKETRESPILHIYLELRNGRQNEKEATEAINECLVAMKEDYAYMVKELGFKLLEVTLLPSGAFQGYAAEQQAAGADPAWWKPPHINPSDKVLAALGAETKVTVKVR
jgi:phenylacetate-coenzyme A ligase PaaK-like adenylate-forming protein